MCFYRCASLFLTWVGHPFLRLIFFSCRVEVRGLEEFHQQVQNSPTYLAIWHNRLALLTSILLKSAPQYRYSAVISQSRDGDLIAGLVDSYKQSRAIRIPARARHQGIRQAIASCLGGEIVVITPDGPRGPKYTLKPGIIFAAQTSQASILPITWVCDRYWKLPTWDQLMIPKPFSRCIVSFGTPFHPQGKESEQAQVLEKEMLKWEKTLWQEVEKTEEQASKL